MTAAAQRQAPSNADEALTALTAFYEGLAHTGLHNLAQIQVLGSMARPLGEGDYLPFTLSPLESILAYDTAEKRTSIIIGENSPEGSFYPSVTERMLHIHSQVALWNDILTTRAPITPAVVPLLQDIMIFTAHVSRIASYLAARSLHNGASKAEHEAAFTAFVASLPPYMSKFFNAGLDRNHVSSILQNLRVGDYTFIEYDVTNDGETVNHYPLPAAMAKPYLAKMEKARVDAARHSG